MKHKSLFAVLAAAAVFAFAVAVMAAAPAGEIMVGEKAGIDAGSKGWVKFTHESHGEFKCVECHHEAKTPEDEANIKSCFACHGKDPAAKGDITAKNNTNPFHKNCSADCHKAKGKGPTKCKECHGGGEE